MTAVQYTFILCLPRKGWAMAPLSGIDLGSCRLGIRIRGYARGTETAVAPKLLLQRVPVPTGKF